MTQLKAKWMKRSMNREFQLIHELCLHVLLNTGRPDIIKATLSMISAFLCWLPLKCVFGSPLLERLLDLLPVLDFRNLTLKCLIEAASLTSLKAYEPQVVKMYCTFMTKLKGMLPCSINISEFYASGNSEEQAFIQNLTFFLTSFFKFKIRVLESVEGSISDLLLGLEYLLRISHVDDTEVFKVCLDYWNSIVSELFESQQSLDDPVSAPNLMGLQLPTVPVGSMGRHQLYADPLTKLRALLITKDSDVQYKLVRETLLCLSYLLHADTEQQDDKDVQSEEFSAQDDKDLHAKDATQPSEQRNISVKNMDNFAALPYDLLIQIAKRIEKLEDFVSFRCVSKSFASAGRDEDFMGLPLRKGTPYLMLSVRDDATDDFRRIYSLVDGGGSVLESVRVPNLKNKRCLESLGWLLVTEVNCSMSLLEPFSGTKIPLPSEYSLYDEYWAVDAMGFCQKMVLTSSPSETSDYVLVCIVLDGYLGCWLPGKAEWDCMKFVGNVVDIVYYGDGEFLGICQPGVVFSFNLSHENYGFRVVLDLMSRDFHSRRDSVNDLVQSKRLYMIKEEDGSLLIISRRYPATITRASELGSYDPVFLTSTVFRAYRVDIGTCTFNEIFSLGNMAVFLGHNHPIAVDASRYHGGVMKPNHIYFTDDYWDFYHRLACPHNIESGVYDLETEAIASICPGEESPSIVSPSLWITLPKFGS